jgi:hypothetical protein
VIYKLENQEWVTIVDFTPTDLVRSRGMNSIAGVCNDGEYEFYLNDNLIHKFEDSSNLGSEIALFAYTYFVPESVVRFDNFAAEGLD